MSTTTSKDASTPVEMKEVDKSPEICPPQVAINDSPTTDRQRIQRGTGTGYVFAHSIAYPPCFGKKPNDFKVESIVNYWKNHSYNSTIPYKSFGEKVLNDLMSGKMFNFALGDVSRELQERVPETNIVFFPEICRIDVKFDKLLMMSAIHIGTFLKEKATSLGIAQYRDICDILAQMGDPERPYFIEIIENYIEVKLQHIASTVSVQNLKFVMSKLKLNNTVSLIHQIFCSPTLSGKLTGIYRLLELHELIWNTCDWCTLDNLAKFLYQCWSWIMEKTELAKEFAQNGFKWSKPQDIKDTAENIQKTVVEVSEKENQAKEDMDFVKNYTDIDVPAKLDPLPCINCKGVASLGCSLCGMHLCETCRKRLPQLCKCKGAKSFIHYADRCACKVSLDCFWTAVAANLNISIICVKRMVWEWMQRIDACDQYNSICKLYQVTNITPHWEGFVKEIHTSLKLGYLTEGLDATIVTVLVFNAYVQISRFNDIEDAHPASVSALKIGKPKTYIDLFYYPQGIGHYAPGLGIIEENPDQLAFGTPFTGWSDAEEVQTAHVLKMNRQYSYYTKIRKEYEEKKDEEILSEDFSSLYNSNSSISTTSSIRSIVKIINETPANNVSLDAETISQASVDSLGSDFTLSSNTTIDSLNEMLQNFKNYKTPSESQSVSGDEPRTKEEVDNIVNDGIEQKLKNPKPDSFWHLLKECQWSELGKRIKEWFATMSKDVLKWFDENKLLSGIISMILGIASFIGINVGTFAGGKAGAFLAKFANAQRTMFYADRSFSTLSKTLAETVDVAKEVLGVSPCPEIDDFKQQVSEALELALKMQQQASFSPGEFVNDGKKFLEFSNKFNSLQKVYTSLSKFRDAKYLTVIAPIWAQLNTTYHALCATYGKVMVSVKTRQEVVCIYIYGETAIGKTHMAEAIVYWLNKLTNRNMSVYTVSKGNDYWNAYAQQDIIRIDDMNAVVGNEQDIDSVNVYNICTSAPFNPNQAALEDKNIMLNAKFLIICSNHPTVPSNSLVTYRHAWERRRNLFIKASWPEHEKCPKGVTNCHHIRMRDQRTEQLGGISDYSHLELRLCNPIVSRQSNDAQPNQRLPKNSKQKWEVIAEEEIDNQGVVVDLQTIVRGALWWEAKYHQEYLKKLSLSPQGEFFRKNEAHSWVNKPFILLHGDPGTGKSHILQRVKEMHRGTVVVIDSGVEFDEFSKEGFKADEVSMVIINDFSALVMNNINRLTEMTNYIRQIYDENVKPSYLLVIACNLGLLESQFAKLDQSGEMFGLFKRRFTNIIAKFKPKPHQILRNIGNRMFKVKTHWTEADIKNKVDTPKFVEYTCEGKVYSQETVVCMISDYVPEVQEISLRNCLSFREEIAPDSIVAFPMDTFSFLDLVNNGTLVDVLKIITQGKVRTLSNNGLTIKTLGPKLQRIVKSAEDLQGSTILNLESLLLQAWNKGLLTEFKGYNVVMHFPDRMFYIAGREDPIECGHLVTRYDLIEAFKAEVEVLEEVVNMTTVFDSDRNFLPHWAILAGEIFSTVLCTASTAVSSVFSVMDQREMFKAQEEALVACASFESAIKKVKEESTKYISDAIESAAPYSASKLKPGVQNYYADQYSDEDTDPLFEDETPPDEKNGQGKKGKGSNYARKRQRRYQEDETVKLESSRDNYVLNRDFLKSAPVLEEVRFECSQIGSPPQDLIKQISSDPATRPILDKILKNVCEIHDLSGKRLCSGIFVRGRLVRTVTHLIDKRSVKEIRVFTQDKKTYEVEYVDSNELLHTLNLRVTDTTCPQYQDITTHFVSAEASIHENSRAILVTPSIDPFSGKLQVIIRPMLVQNYTFKRWSDGNTISWHYRGHKIGLTATGSQTDNGDCGSILIVCDQNLTTGKVIGMHYAATKDTALASTLNRSQYEDKIVYQCADIRETDYMEPASDPEIPSYVGRSKVKVFLPSKTKLHRNWFPVGEEIFEPSVLSSRDPRGPPKDVLYDECEKWITPPVEVPGNMKDVASEVAEEIAHQTADILAAEGVKLRKLTNTEALNKIREFDKSEPINMHTSAGFPYNKMTTNKGKHNFLQIDDQGIRHFSKDPKNKHLVQLIQTRVSQIEDEQKAVEDQLGLVIFQIFLKDELVKKKKKIYTDAKKTRTIGAVDLPFLIAYRKYFHAAQAAMMDHWHKLFIAVGINPLSLDWHLLYSKLAKNSLMGLDLDFKDWDFSHPPFFWDLLSKFWVILYERLDPTCTERDTARRKKLYKFLQSTLILIGPELHRMLRGLPSGYPGTSIDGSICNMIMLVTAWIVIMSAKNPQIANLTGFNEDVVPVFYSDDLFISISEYVAPMFNGFSIAEIYKKFGFNPQPASKDGEIVPYKPLEDCTFLSRHFKYWSGYWIGPLKIDNMNKSTHFCTDRKSHFYWESPDSKCESIDIVESCYRSVLYNAALWGKDTYSTYECIYNKLAVQLGFPRAPTWRSTMSEMFPIGHEVDYPKGYHTEEFPEIKEHWHHSLPQNFKAYKDRTTYHFGPEYSYNGGPSTNKMPPKLKTLLELVNKRFNKNFNSILVNKYPPGGKIPWHKDNEPCIDFDEGIVGITAKGDGRMHFKSTTEHFSFYQNSGLAYVLTAENLAHYYHMRDSHIMETYTFTFRKVVPRANSSPPQERTTTL